MSLSRKHNGLIILLNGTSNSGKTVFAKKLVKHLPRCSEHISINTFVNKTITTLPHAQLCDAYEILLRMNYLHMLNTSWRKKIYKELFYKHHAQFSATWRLSMQAMNTYIKKAVKDGKTIVVEHTFAYDHDLKMFVESFAHEQVFFVKLICNEQTVRNREKQKAKQPAGWSLAQQEQIHQYHNKPIAYDITIDTSDDSEQAIQQILVYLNKQKTFSAVKKNATLLHAKK